MRRATLTQANRHEPESVKDVLSELDDLASSREQVCVRDVLDDFGKRSFGPFMMLPALLELTPVGGIPGVPTFLALVIALTAVQLFMGREHVWMPQFIQTRSVSGRKLHKAVHKLRGVAGFLDRHSEGRLEWMTQGWVIKLIAIVVILLCCTVPPLELLPFASSIPMLAIAIIGLALTVRDGGLVLAAMIFTAIAVGAGLFFLFTSNAASNLAG